MIMGNVEWIRWMASPFAPAAVIVGDTEIWQDGCDNCR